jgi:hypothetical protein
VRYPERSIRSALQVGQYVFSRGWNTYFECRVQAWQKEGVCQVFYNNGVLSHEFWCKDDQNMETLHFFDPYGVVA